MIKNYQLASIFHFEIKDRELCDDIIRINVNIYNSKISISAKFRELFPVLLFITGFSKDRSFYFLYFLHSTLDQFSNQYFFPNNAIFAKFSKTAYHFGEKVADYCFASRKRRQTPFLSIWKQGLRSQHALGQWKCDEFGKPCKRSTTLCLLMIARHQRVSNSVSYYKI